MAAGKGERMAYDEGTAARVREALGEVGFTERKMFGGLCFMVNGNMCCGVQDSTLVLRLGNEGAEKALKKAHTSEMDFTGRSIKSIVYVAPEGFSTKQKLKTWLRLAIEFAETLPAK